MIDFNSNILLNFIFSIHSIYQAISQYCRYYHQSKPFSHITIDLFKETVEKMCSKKSQPTDVYVLPKLTKDEHKSDTDSGHSSIHGDKEFVDKTNEQLINRQPSKLKVARGMAEMDYKIEQFVEQKNVIVIGHNEPNDALELEKKPVGAALQVIRRKDAILRRKNMQRRNTIDINCSDMLKASNEHFGFGAAKSTNCLDKVGTKDSYEFGAVMNGSSMPGTID